MEIETNGQFDTLAMFQKRIEILVYSRVRDKDRVLNAIEIQDKLREKSKNFNGAKEIRKWRDKRCSF